MPLKICMELITRVAAGGALAAHKMCLPVHAPVRRVA